jgi:Transposase zinc-ribbon domain
MADGLLQDLPRDLPTFLERFGTDEACRAYLVLERWPEGFRCDGCSHDRAYSHRQRLIEEYCVFKRAPSWLSSPYSHWPSAGSLVCCSTISVSGALFSLRGSILQDTTPGL